MKQSLKTFLMAGLCAALASLLALPVLASSSKDEADLLHNPGVVYSGIDLWSTPANGSSFSDFSRQPIPAGFFCQGSAPFTGVITFKGAGLKTVPEGILGGADTIIHRMDDAVFDKDGVALTRVKFLALSLVSAEPIQTDCGQFQAQIRLKGEQPVTTMRIERHDQNGGIYTSTLAVNARVVFAPVEGEAPQTLELEQKVRFAPNRSSWSREPASNASALENYAHVDVDGDGLAETPIPGPSNFKPGLMVPSGVLARAVFQEPLCELAVLETPPCPEGCHCDPSAEWTSNPACANWSIAECDHCHCPGLPDPRDP